MNTIYDMNQIELDFQRFFELTGICTMDRAMTMEEYESAMRSGGESFAHLVKGPREDFGKQLEEDVFFSDREDISAVRHIRFMPALYHVSEFFELECVLSGSIICYIGENRMELTAGDVLILAPQTNHAACVYREDGIMVNLLVRKSTFEERFMNLLPDNSLLRSFFESALYHSASTPYLLFRTDDLDFLQPQIFGILQEWQRNLRYKNSALTALLQMFFVNLLRLHEKDVIIPTISKSVMNEDTIFMLEYMQNNFATITLSHLAAFFNYSERQIQRRIRAATGLSFVENIRNLRMKKAAELLKDPKIKVAHIAEHLGYYDVSSFRHAFQAYYGMPPTAFRNL